MGHNYYYEKGQRDYWAGRYEPPHSAMGSLLAWTESSMREQREDNAAYEKGYANARSQGRR